MSFLRYSMSKNMATLTYPSLGQSRSLKVVPFDRLMVSCLLVSLFKSNFVPKSTVVEIFDLKPRSLQIIRTDTCRSATNDFILTFYGNYTVYEINGDFSRKSQIFPTPCILRPSLRLPLVIGYRRLVSRN